MMIKKYNILQLILYEIKEMIKKNIIISLVKVDSIIW